VSFHGSSLSVVKSQQCHFMAVHCLLLKVFVLLQFIMLVKCCYHKFILVLYMCLGNSTLDPLIIHSIHLNILLDAVGSAFNPLDPLEIHFRNPNSLWIDLATQIDSCGHRFKSNQSSGLKVDPTACDSTFKWIYHSDRRQNRLIGSTRRTD